MKESSILGRLLVLLAVVLMPLGMQPAAASAPASDHHGMMAGKSAGHCPDRSSWHELGAGTCSIACALPAQEFARDDRLVRDHELVAPVLAQTLHGVLLEIATPPPKAG
jgi:hypothetical protein